MTGSELKTKRKLMKLNQAEFAKFLGVSQEMVSMMESGIKAVPESIAMKLEDGDDDEDEDEEGEDIEVVSESKVPVRKSMKVSKKTGMF